MANDKTGNGKTEAEKTAAETPEAEASEDAVTVPAPEATDTVDAEIVDETATDDRVETESVADGGDASSEERPATETPKKKGGGGFLFGLVLVIAVIAVLAVLFGDRIGLFGGGEETARETTPGVTVTEDAQPFPGNELDGPITAEAAPGTREAAARADAEDEAASSRNALRARAAERARARREAQEAQSAAASAADEDGETTGAASEDEVTDAAAETAEPGTDRQDGTDQLGFVSPDGDSEMAEAVRAARAEQERIRQEDRAAREAALSQAREAQSARADDPNALPAAPADDEGGETADAATLRERMMERDAADDEAAERQEAASEPPARAPRPTGRVAQAADDQSADEGASVADDADRAQPARPRPPVIAVSRSDSDEALSARLEAVEADLRDALRQDLRAEVREDVLAEANARIERVITQTEAEVESLRAALSEQEQRSDARIAQLQDRLEVLQSRDATANTRGVLILALSNLRGELDAGRPFERQLDDVEQLAPNVTSLRSARRFAATGLPTNAELRLQFRDAERAALQAEAGADADGFFEEMWANLKGLFTVRRIGETEGETTSAIISRAQAALARNEVDAAVAELEALEGPAAEAFEPFLADARALAATRVQIERLERAVLDADGSAPSRRG